MEEKTNKIIGYSLLAVAFFGLFVAPILLLFHINPTFTHFEYWQVQGGWVVTVFVVIITLGNSEVLKD